MFDKYKIRRLSEHTKHVVKIYYENILSFIQYLMSILVIDWRLLSSHKNLLY